MPGEVISPVIIMEYNPDYIGDVFIPEADAYLYCFGLVLDPADVVVKIILGGAISEINKVKKNGVYSAHFIDKTDNKRNEISLDLENSIFTPLELSERLGKVLVISHNAGLLTSDPAEVGGITHLFVWGKKGDKEPDKGYLTTSLQKFGEKPILLEWLPILWNEIVKRGLVEPCKDFGGFGPAWDLSLDRKTWDQIFLKSFKSGELK